jgi:hypothetical protein
MKTTETNKNASVLQKKENAAKADKNSSSEGALSMPFFQPKLSVNDPNDIYEKEADAVAEEVMRMPAGDHFFKPASPVIARVCDDCEREEELKRKELQETEPVLEPPVPEVTEVRAVIQRKEEEEEEANEMVMLQRKCSHCEEDEKLQRKEENEEENMLSLKPLGHLSVQKKCAECEKEEQEEIQRKENDSHGEYATSNVEQVLASFGQPMNNAVRGFMEQRFGYDFSSVQIHNDSLAHQSSSDINAKAYTHQNHIVFGAGEYQPDSYSGKELLAHELTHVIQQNGEGVSKKEASIQRESFSSPRSSAQTGITTSLGHSITIQRKPVEEPKKYEGIIDYKKARKENLDSWYSHYKFFNLFKEKEVYPGITPIAYANHVYELQLKIEIAKQASKWEAKEPGILESEITADSVLIQLITIAEQYAKDKTDLNGFDTAMLDRIHTYWAAMEPSPPPLVSEYFSNVWQFETVNKNEYFHINFDDRGDYVYKLQKALMVLNYDIGNDAKLNAEKEKEPTGIFGTGTKQAVINFQKDSGFEGKDADGVVGQMTLRFLDKRLGAPLYKTPSSGGNLYVFHVPVYPEDMLKDKAAFKDELLLRVLTVAFPITTEKADVLKRSNWKWAVYHDLTQEEVDRGYQRVTIPKASYGTIMSGLEGGSGKDISKELEIQALDLLQTTGLRELIKKIKAKELERAYVMMSYGGTGDMKHKPTRAELEEMKQDQAKIAALDKEIDALIKERDELLRSLDITLEDYEKMQKGFIENFEKFAAQTAFKMLAENEIQANIEYEHYKNMAEVQVIKTILSDLSVKYKDSEKFWWEAVSFEDSKGKNSGLYKSTSDYISQNSYPDPDFGTIDFSDPSKYYNEENVAKKYQAEEKSSTPYYKNWQEKEKQVVTTLQDAVKKYPILAYPKLSLRNNAGKKAAMDDAALQKHLQNIISDKDDGGIKENIESVRTKIKEDYKEVWTMPVVIMRAKIELGVVKDTILDDLINEKQKQVNTNSFWQSIGLAVLGIGLGLLALASGPVGWLALGASIAVGAYDAYKTYEDITFKKQTANTAIDPADALGTEDPSYFWFWVSLVCVGLDVLQAAKLVKSISKASTLAKDVNEGLNASRRLLEKELEEVGQASERGKQILKEIGEVDEALTKVKTTEFIENQKFLEPLKSNPMAVVVMSQALKDKKIVKAITVAGKMLDKETFETVLKFYGGIGRNSMDELPELMRLIQGSELSKTAIKDILTDTRIQRVLLDTQDVAAFAKQHDAWKAAVKGGESISFIQFLEKQGLKPGFAADTKLVDMFGEAFAKLPSATKNRQIIRTIEPALLDAFNAGKLPPQVQKAMEVIINSDILAESARLSSAQQRLLYELKTMGSVIETQSDLTKVMQLLNNPTARKALWDGASQLAGREEYMAKIFSILKDKPLSPDVFDDMIRIGPMTDTGTIELLLQESSKEIRKLLAASPEAVAVLKKCASPCLPAFLKADDILLVQKIMKGKSAEDTLKMREYLYGLRDNEALFKQALKDLDADYAKVIKDVKLPALAKPVKLKASNEALRRIIDLGLPVSELNKIMANASKVAAGDDIIYDLMKVLELEKSVSSPNFGKLLSGLSSTNPEEFRIARHLLDESASFVHASEVGATKFKYTGLQKADALLGRFTLAELGSLMNTRWGEGFVNHVYDITQKMPGLKNTELLDLASKAGSGGKGDLSRLKAIVDSLGKSTVTFDEAAKAVDAANSFKGEIAKALKDPATGFDAMAKLIWGEKAAINGENIKIGEALGNSGSAILDTATGLGKADGVAENLLTAGKLDPAKWEVFKKVINGADIEQILKNKLIGDMWGLTNMKALEKEGYKLGSTMFTEITLTTGKIEARADAILIKGKEIIVVEFKTGGNVYRKGQQEIYQLLKDGQSKAVMVLGNEYIATKFANPDFKITYKAIEESVVVGVH